jgi:hypothetical protein
MRGRVGFFYFYYLSFFGRWIERSVGKEGGGGRGVEKKKEAGRRIVK